MLIADLHQLLSQQIVSDTPNLYLAVKIQRFKPYKYPACTQVCSPFLIGTRNGQAILRQIVYSISLSALCARALCFVRNGPAKVPTNRCRYIETSGATKVHLSNDTVAQDAYICHSHAQHHIAGLIHPQKNLNLDFSVHFMVGTSAQTARGHVSKISSIFTQ